MNRAGIYIDNLTGEATYQSFKPNPLPPMPEIEMDEEIVKLLVDANKQLVKLDTASQLISNADLWFLWKQFVSFLHCMIQILKNFQRQLEAKIICEQYLIISSSIQSLILRELQRN